LWCDIRYFLGSEIFLVRILWSLLVFFVLISVRGDLFFVDFPARVLRLPLIRTSPPTSSGSCSISKFPIFAFVSVFSCRILMPLLFVPTQFPAPHFMPVSSECSRKSFYAGFLCARRITPEPRRQPVLAPSPVCLVCFGCWC
jgi:hypothetical protein